MAIYYPTGCDALVPDHICDPCEPKEKGRIGSVAFVKTSFVFADISDPNEWRTGINAGDIIVVPDTLGSFDGGAEQLAPGYGRQDETLTGYKFTANFKDPNYKQNAAFYNALKLARNYKFLYVTETQIHDSENAVQVIPKNPVTEDLNSDVVWDVTVKWAGPDLPEPQDVPPGIFDRCFLTT